MMDTIEGNKLIAEFMGYKKCQFNYGRYELPFRELENDLINGEKYGAYFIEGRLRYEFLPEEMKFHYSWDWLMPVVEKIESLTYINDNNETDYWFFKKGNHCVGFWLDTWGKPYQVKGVEDHTYSFRLQETLIQSTWLAVVEFIKWYNANK